MCTIFTDKLLANGVEVMLETEVPLSRGRVYTINQLLFVDNDRVRTICSNLYFYCHSEINYVYQCTTNHYHLICL